MPDLTTSEPETRERILSAAEEQFRQFGPNKTSMEEIAAHAGLARATLYLHFSGKGKLYEALLTEITKRFVEEIASLVASERPAPRKLRLFVELTAATYANNPVFLAALTEDRRFSMQKVAAPMMSNYRNEILKPLRQILEQGIEEGTLRTLDVEETAYLMYELGNQLLIKELSGRAEYPLSKILDVMDNVVAHGILIDSVQGQK